MAAPQCAAAINESAMNRLVKTAYVAADGMGMEAGRGRSAKACRNSPEAAGTVMVYKGPGQSPQAWPPVNHCRISITQIAAGLEAQS